MDGDEKTLDDRTLYRRKRRVRNQIIAYTVVFILLAVVAAGGVFGVSLLAKRAEARRQEKELAEQLEALAKAEQEVIAPPVSAAEVSDVTEEGETDWLEELVTASIAEMPLEDKVAGLFLTTPEAITGVGKAVQAGDGTRDALSRYAVGGLVYSSRNIQSREQLVEMLSNTKSMSKYPLFLAIEEDGDGASGVAGSGIGTEAAGDMWGIGESGNTETAYQSGVQTASYLKELGFNLNLGPAADLTEAPDQSIVGKDSYGKDPGMAGSMAASAVSGMEDTGISACLKHFPGIGLAASDPAKGMAVLDRSMQDLQAAELEAFRMGTSSEVDMVMVSHVSLPQILGDQRPCSLSEEIVTDVLRGELGYQGIILTDAMDQGAVTEYYAAGEAAVMALKAGCDMVYMPGNFEEAYQAVLSAVKEGVIAQERVEESLKKIYRVKLRDKLETESAEGQ